jgi:hypothetical protein
MISISADDDNDSDEDEDDDIRDDNPDTLIGSESRVHQMLSLFFCLFTQCDDEFHRNKKIILDSVTDFIGNISALIRNEVLAAPKILMVGPIKYVHIAQYVTYYYLKACQHLLSMFETLVKSLSSKSNSEEQFTIYDSLRLRLAAALSREVLKFGGSKNNKTCVKEYLKALNALNIKEWLQPNEVLLT